MARVLPFLLLFILSVMSGPASAGQIVRKASLIPHWVPQAQFAGYYVALDKGIYRKYGIDLAIIQGGPDRPAMDLLARRKADFATAWLSSALKEHSRGIRIVNIAQIVQKSALMLVARKSSGIRTPADLKNRKVGLWEGDFEIQPRALFKKFGLHVDVVPQSFSVNLFLRGGVDAASAMWYNEYHTILNSGVDADELTTIFFSDYGLNFPEDGLYTLEDTYRRDPSLCNAFVRASVEGWLYAFSHPDEAVDIVLKYMEKAGLPANRTHQKWMLARMKDLIVPAKGNGGIGILGKKDYETVAGVLKDAGIVRNIPQFTTFSRRCGNDPAK